MSISKEGAQNFTIINITWHIMFTAVSYTHLDVYKRQIYNFEFLDETHMLPNVLEILGTKPTLPVT